MSVSAGAAVLAAAWPVGAFLDLGQRARPKSGQLTVVQLSSPKEGAKIASSSTFVRASGKGDASSARRSLTGTEH